jgi:hypothetical protein
MNLTVVSTRQNTQYNQIHFALTGNANFFEVNNQGRIEKGTSPSSTLLSPMDSEGNVLFELVHEDDDKLKYFGYSCSSTFNDCRLPELELTLNKETNTWYVHSESLQLIGIELEAL